MKECLVTLVLIAAVAGDARAANTDEWWGPWTAVDHAHHFGSGTFNGRDNAYETHPATETKPFRWLRTITATTGTVLHMEVSARADDYARCDWILAVKANGNELLRKQIHGTTWQNFDVSLSRYAGKTVELELINQANGWHWEVAYWSNVRVGPTGNAKDSPATKTQADERAAPKASIARAPRSAAEPERRMPTGVEISEWDDMLKARIAEQLASGQSVSCFFASMRRKARVLAATDGGAALRIRSGPVETVVAWNRLSASEKKSLALSVCRDGLDSDHAIAAFYLMLIGEDGRTHLQRAGELGERVRSLFKAETEDAPAEQLNLSSSNDQPRDTTPQKSLVVVPMQKNRWASRVVGRLAVPNSRDRQRARGEVRKRHQADYANSDPATIAELPQRFLSLGSEEDDPALRYEYLQQARKNAAARGDLATAMAATELLVSHFEGLDSIEERVNTLGEYRDPDRLSERARAASEAMLSLIDESLAEHRYHAARRLLKDATSILRAANSPDLSERLEEAREKTLRAVERITGKGWAEAWKYAGDHSEHKAHRGEYNGRQGVWETHPPREQEAFVWSRTVWLARGKRHSLEMDVSARTPPPAAHGKPIKDFVLVVRANGEELINRVIGGSSWRAINVDLTKFSGQSVEIEMLNQTGGRYPWYEEYAYWDNVRIVSTQ